MTYFLPPFPKQSNRADFMVTLDAFDNDTGDAYDLTGVTINVTIADERGCTRISASTSDGKVALEVPEDGEASITIRASELKNIPAGQYQLGIQFVDGEDTSQPYVGILPIFEGLPR